MRKNPTQKERIEKFVASYRVHQNSTQAAIDAGYNPSGARSMGSKMRKLPEVERLLNGGEAQVTIEEIKGKVLSDDQLKVALSEIISNRGQKDSTRLQAIDLLAKAHGMYKNDAPININLFNGLSEDKGAKIKDIIGRVRNNQAIEKKEQEAEKVALISVDNKSKEDKQS